MKPMCSGKLKSQKENVKNLLILIILFLHGEGCLWILVWMTKILVKPKKLSFHFELLIQCLLRFLCFWCDANVFPHL